jgi:tRNA pseudouridine13 synthase
MAAPTDATFGIEGFLTTTPPMGGRLKARYEDFIVEETGPAPPSTQRSAVTAAKIRLTNWETNRFVRDASHALGMSRRGLHFSGTKDKRAVTTQWFTVRARPDDVQQLSRMRGVEVLECHPTPRERALGDHLGNAFTITVRDLVVPVAQAKEILERAQQELQTAGGFPNFYGPQRFGATRATTHLVGRKLVAGDFQSALDAYLSTPSDDESPALAQARARYAQDRDAAAMLKSVQNEDADFERAVLQSLVEAPDDPVRAFTRFPPPLQTLFVYAHQSHLFNRILSRRMAMGLPIARAVVGDLVAPVREGNVDDEWLPVGERNLAKVNREIERGRLAVTGLVPGTQAPQAGGAMGQIERAILAEEGVDTRDFLIPDLLNISSKGTRRALAVAVPDLKWEMLEDSPAPTLRLAFTLPKGVYATILLRELLKLADVKAYG